MIDTGTLAVNDGASLGSGDVTMSGAVLAAGTASWSTSKNIILSGAGSNNDVNTNGQNITLAGVVSGPATCASSGRRHAHARRRNTYTGNTIFPSTGGGGTIRTETANALGTGNLQVSQPTARSKPPPIWSPARSAAPTS